MKKLSTLIALGATVISGAVFARYNGPLLEVTRSPGFVMPEYAVATQCQIFSDRVETNKQVAHALEAKEVRKLQITTAQLYKLIGQAASGKVTTSHGPTDVGVTSYQAFQIQPNDTVAKVILSQKGEIDSTNDALASIALKNFLDLNCK